MKTLLVCILGFLSTCPGALCGFNENPTSVSGTTSGSKHSSSQERTDATAKEVRRLSFSVTLGYSEFSNLYHFDDQIEFDEPVSSSGLRVGGAVGVYLLQTTQLNLEFGYSWSGYKTVGFSTGAPRSKSDFHLTSIGITVRQFIPQYHLHLTGGYLKVEMSNDHWDVDNRTGYKYLEERVTFPGVLFGIGSFRDYGLVTLFFELDFCILYSRNDDVKIKDLKSDAKYPDNIRFQGLRAGISLSPW